MKKLLVCLVSCLLLVLSACGQSPANSAAPPAAPHPTATPTDTPIPTPVPTKPLSLDEQIQQVMQGAHATVVVGKGTVTETEMLSDCCARDDDIHLECFNL